MQTPKMHWTACLWPGLPQLWRRGSWVGLAVAVGFTVLANTLLLATLVYDDWMTGELRQLGFGALAAVWLLAWWRSRVWRSNDSPAAADADAVDDLPEGRDLLFREAQQRYLASDWVATEQLLLKLLKQDARDVETRLMLATLWRHQGRPAEATRQLDRLERLEAADGWRHEIAAERAAIAGEESTPTISVVRQDDQTPDNTTSRKAA